MGDYFYIRSCGGPTYFNKFISLKFGFFIFSLYICDMNTTKNSYKDLSVKELNVKRNKINELMREFNYTELMYAKQMIDRELESRKLGNRIKNTLNKVFNGII